MTDLDKRIDEIMELDRKLKAESKRHSEASSPCSWSSSDKERFLSIELQDKAPEMVSIIRELQAELAAREQTIRATITEIIHVAGELVVSKGYPSYYFEDHSPPLSDKMPMKNKIYIQNQFEEMEKRNKIHAIKLKQAVDKLRLTKKE